MWSCITGGWYVLSTNREWKGHWDVIICYPLVLRNYMNWTCSTFKIRGLTCKWMKKTVNVRRVRQQSIQGLMVSGREHHRHLVTPFQWTVSAIRKHLTIQKTYYVCKCPGRWGKTSEVCRASNNHLATTSLLCQSRSLLLIKVKCEIWCTLHVMLHDSEQLITHLRGRGESQLCVSKCWC